MDIIFLIACLLFTGVAIALVRRSRIQTAEIQRLAAKGTELERAVKLAQQKTAQQMRAINRLHEEKRELQARIENMIG